MDALRVRHQNQLEKCAFTSVGHNTCVCYFAKMAKMGDKIAPLQFFVRGVFLHYMTTC